MHQTFYKEINPEDLPLPSGTSIRLIEACTQADTDVDTLAPLISTNPIISTRLLAFVNSPFYGFSQTIQSISHAVVAMGLESVKNLALCFAIKDSLNEKVDLLLDSDSFWAQSTFRAVACQEWFRCLSERPLTQDEKSQAFTAGLFADLGFLMLFIMEPNKVDRFDLLLANAPSSRLNMERDLFHTSHAEIAAMMMRAWKLPEIYASSILCHHHSGIKTNGNTLSMALALADWSVALIYSFDKTLALQELLKLQDKIGQTELDDFFRSLAEKAQTVGDTTQLAKSQEYNLDHVFQQANIKLAQDNINFQELTWKLQSALKDRDNYSARLNEELSIAREIQQSLQSDTSYREHVAAINIPAKVLSGDFFDYYEHDNGMITFCLGDVSGKGTHAALIMAKTVSLYRCLTKVEKNLSSIVKLMNDEIFETSVRGMFVTFIAGKLDLNRCGLEIVNAGHIPALKIGASSIHQIEPHGPPLGVMDNVDYVAECVPFENHRLYLYTDGITESKKANGEELGTKEFLRWIVQSKQLPLKEQLKWLRKKFDSDISEWKDDLTLMMLSSKG